MKKIDMSEKAILKRFSQTEQLREVSRFLMKAKKSQDERHKTADSKKLQTATNQNAKVNL